jgi:CheY-like chemotaxis protein
VNAQKKPETVRRLSILVADDEPDTLATLAALLTDEGHTVHTVYRGDQVPEAVRRYKPDVCIFDIVMPGKTGYELARDLSQLGPNRPVLIAMSAVYVRDSEQFLAQAVGFDRSFVKPTDPKKLLALIEQIAASDKQI